MRQPVFICLGVLIVFLSVVTAVTACTHAPDQHDRGHARQATGDEKADTNTTGTEETAATAETAAAAGGSDLSLAYIEWEANVASTHVIKKVLEDEGFKVNVTPADAGTLWSGIADGEIDGTVSAWLPNTHKGYYEKYKGQFDDLGANLTGVKTGLVVPSYVPVRSIDELQVYSGTFNNRIFGIERDAGIMPLTEEAVRRYELPLEIVPGSSDDLITDLAAALEKKDWIVATGWSPHHLFAQFDVKFLEDPKHVYGNGESIHTITRRGLSEEMPEAYNILERFQWNIDDVEGMMLAMANGMSPEKAAEAWLEQNEEKVQAWIGKTEATSVSR